MLSTHPPSTSSLPGARQHTTNMAAHRLPPELLRYICQAADSDSWSCRLVCRYWNTQCTHRVFEQIDIKKSPERVRALWRRTRALAVDPASLALRRHAKAIVCVPGQNAKTIEKAPWLHLLVEASSSLNSVWTHQDSPDTDPYQLQMKMYRLPAKHGRIRSVHVGLPRSIPRSFSRGIKTLILRQGRFRRFEDWLHLVSELPDLEWVSRDADFDMFQPEIPRRRPRTIRNQLRSVTIGASWVSDEIAKIRLNERCAVVALVTFLSAYDTASFLSDGETALVLALLRLLGSDPPWSPNMRYRANPRGNSRQLGK